MNFNVNFNVLLSKYVVHQLVKLKKDFDNRCESSFFSAVTKSKFCKYVEHIDSTASESDRMYSI